MTKPKHVQYLERFSKRLEDLDLDPGEIVGTVDESGNSILLRLVAESGGGSELLFFRPYHIELKLGYGKPDQVESVFLVSERDTFAGVVDTQMYRVNEGSELHSYGSLIAGVNLPEGSMVPLCKSRTLSELSRKLERYGLYKICRE